MNRIAKFEKVSYEQFRKDFKDTYTWGDMIAFELIPFRFTEPDECVIEAAIRKVYDNIKLPERGTKDSAGYDYFAPFKFTLKPNQTIKIITGIKCQIDKGWFHELCPRSGSGSEYRIQLNNTLGIIDGDYYNNNKNEGHIMAKITNDSNENKTATFESGKGYMQGIFTVYGITKDDEVDDVRTGGFGSTDKK